MQIIEAHIEIEGLKNLVKSLYNPRLSNEYAIVMNTRSDRSGSGSKLNIWFIQTNNGGNGR
jgi:hypothetical protein